MGLVLSSLLTMYFFELLILLSYVFYYIFNKSLVLKIGQHVDLIFVILFSPVSYRLTS